MDLKTGVDRARLLLQQGRAHDAAAEARQILAQDPNHAKALDILSTCSLDEKKFAAALDFAKRAVAIESDNPFLLYTLANAQFYNKEIQQAQQTIETGLQIAPYFFHFWHLRGRIALHEERWEDALAAAERGLAFRPNDVHLINLRAQSLIQLKRSSEAESTIEFALNKAPDDPYSHANRGWVYIEQDRYDDAITAFREALRINPNLDHARSGLKEAIRGKNWLYRGVLKYFLWMSKLGSQARWGLIIGLYLASRFVDQWSDAAGWTGRVASALVMIYVAFAVSTWIGRPLSNLFLQFHPLGKLALDDDEKRASYWIGVLLTGCGLLLLAARFVTENWKSLSTHLGFTCLLLLIPVAGAFSVPEKSKSRRYLVFYAIAIAFLLLGTLRVPDLLYLAIIGIFCNGWVANYLIEKEAREF